MREHPCELSILRVDIGCGERNKMRPGRIHVGEGIGPTGVGKQANGDLWHSNSGGLCANSESASREDPEATAHDNAMAPRKGWFWVLPKLIVQSIFALKKGLAVGAGAARMRLHIMIQRLDIAPSRKCLFA